MDGDAIRVQTPTAYYLAHLISALDRIRARDEGLEPAATSPGSSAGWDEASGNAVILPFPAPGWAVPMSA